MGGNELPQEGLKIVSSQCAEEVEQTVREIIVKGSPRDTMESILRYLYPDKEIDMDKLY